MKLTGETKSDEEAARAAPFQNSMRGKIYRNGILEDTIGVKRKTTGSLGSIENRVQVARLGGNLDVCIYYKIGCSSHFKIVALLDIDGQRPLACSFSAEAFREILEGLRVWG